MRIYPSPRRQSALQATQVCEEYPVPAAPARGMSYFHQIGCKFPGKHETGCAAPEVLLNQFQYEGKLADVWSSGVMLFAMLFCRYPFDPLPGQPSTNRSVFERVVTGLPRIHCCRESRCKYGMPDAVGSPAPQCSTSSRRRGRSRRAAGTSSSASWWLTQISG